MSDENKVLEIEKIAFDNLENPVKGYSMIASYLKDPHKADALIEILKDKVTVRKFLFPAYKIYNLAAHFNDIVESEIAGNLAGYEAAAWNGLTGLTILNLEK